jgi:hypothetical protein
VVRATITQACRVEMPDHTDCACQRSAKRQIRIANCSLIGMIRPLWRMNSTYVSSRADAKAVFSWPWPPFSGVSGHRSPEFRRHIDGCRHLEHVAKRDFLEISPRYTELYFGSHRIESCLVHPIFVRTSNILFAISNMTAVPMLCIFESTTHSPSHSIGSQLAASHVYMHARLQD